ncbi:site-2 protease family protein [Eubacteriaceae bacterium ES3]|nr:site-2 protease family protein [Eubacteriaceae bacterium ES3]
MNPITILVTLIILSVLVVSHEFGHFIAARKTGVFVEEFAIGMGPKLFSRQGKETLFSIRLFPIGGFCKMRGEEPELDEDGNYLPEDPEKPVDEKSFEAKTNAQKLLILVAGSAMNIIFAWVCLLVLAILVGNTNPLDILQLAFINTARFAGIIFQSFAMLLSGQAGLNDVAGPIGMVSMVDTFINTGFVSLLAFTALISVNLGVINMMPLPALDGGRVFIILIEMITRRKFSPEVEGRINFVGFVFLMGLALVIAFNDIMRLSA